MKARPAPLHSPGLAEPCLKSRSGKILPGQASRQFDFNPCERKTDARFDESVGRIDAKGFPMRPTTLVLCLALAGCAGGTTAPDVTGSTPASQSAARPHSPLARAAQASGKNADWWKEGGVTREKINAMCWMKYETGRNDMPVDKRADLVNDCVVKTLKEHPVR
jgi:hypothetical protein